MSDSPLPLLSSSPAPESPTRTANRLNLTQSYALGDWIMQHQQQAKDEPDTKGAEHASIDLGFCVTPANFTAARQARNLEKTKPVTPPSLEERLAQAEAEIVLLRAQINDFNQWNQMKWEGISEITSALKTRLRILEQATFPPPNDPLFPGSPLPLNPGRMASELPLLATENSEPSTPPPSDIQCPTPSDSSAQSDSTPTLPEN